jgi:hypothetical protein
VECDFYDRRFGVTGFMNEKFFSFRFRLFTCPQGGDENQRHTTLLKIIAPGCLGAAAGLGA